MRVGCRILTTLNQGAFFGERALIGDEPRSSTVTAVGAVECFNIDRENFTTHLGPLEEIMAVRKLSAYSIDTVLLRVD
jgi:CRP-like cAMP-binding protein